MHSMCIRKMFVFEFFIITDEIRLKNIYVFNVHKKYDACFRVVHITDEITLNNIYAFNVHKKDVCFRVVHSY